MTTEPFGVLPNGRPVELYTLTNGHGMKVCAMTYGGVIVSLDVPDRNGKSGDIVLGYEDLDSYLAKSPYFGAIVGGLAIGSRTRSSSSTGKSIRSARTTLPTLCMEDSKVLTRSCGRAIRFKMKMGLG